MTHQNYFQNCKTIDEAKKKYYELAKVHHPDRGGETATFQEILNQFEKFKPVSEKFSGEFDQFDAAEYSEIISQLINIPEIIVEICGSWVWISGNTKPYKEQIKGISTGNSYKRGWSQKKGMWYFSPSGYRKRSRTEFNINDIRKMYGSTVVNKNEKPVLAA